MSLRYNSYHSWQGRLPCAGSSGCSASSPTSPASPPLRHTRSRDGASSSGRPASACSAWLLPPACDPDDTLPPAPSAAPNPGPCPAPRTAWALLLASAPEAALPPSPASASPSAAAAAPDEAPASRVAGAPAAAATPRGATWRHHCLGISGNPTASPAEQLILGDPRSHL